MERLNDLQRELNDPGLVDMMETEKEEFRVGDRVRAAFIDGQFYRGEILEVEKSSAKILFYDFGNIDEKVKKSSIHNLPYKQQTQGLSTKCRLACGCTKSSKSTKAFLKLLSTDETLILQVLGGSEDCLEVDLVKTSDDGVGKISLRDSLVFQGDASFYFQNEDKGPVLLPNIFNQSYQTYQLKHREIHKGLVSHVPFVHPGSFIKFSIMVSSAVPVYRLPRLMGEMARAYGILKSERLHGVQGYHLVPGMVCAVRDRRGVWNRGEILAHVRGRIYSVRCVDFGEDIIVTVYHLRRLFTEFMRLPMMSKTVTLPVKVDTMDQARFINQELRNLLLTLEVGFEVVRENVEGQVTVMMDHDGADIARVVKFMKKAIK